MTLKFKSSIYVLMVPIAFMAIILTLAAFPIGLSTEQGRIVSGFLGLSIALGILHVAIKRERSTFQDYQLSIGSKTPKKFFIGFILSITLGGGMILSHVFYSDLQISSNFQNLSGFLLMSMILIPLALMEELIFRSFVLTKLCKTYNIWVAQIVVAILFALYHVIGVNGQSLASAFMGPGIWSFIFVILALKFKGIAAPTGFHYGLNLVLASIGDKAGIPGIWSLDFKENPSIEALQTHETFGFILHSLLLILGIVATIYLQKHMSKVNHSPS